MKLEDICFVGMKNKGCRLKNCVNNNGTCMLEVISYDTKRNKCLKFKKKVRNK